MFRAKKPVSLLTPDLIQLMAIASVEVATKNESAMQRWGIGDAERWSADLAVGTLSFEFGDRTISGPVELLGSYSESAGTWKWGWDNASVPSHVTEASHAALVYGKRHRLTALTTGVLDISDYPTLADDLGAVVVEVAGLAGMYRAPGRSGLYSYLGFRDFAVISQSSGETEKRDTNKK